MYWLLTTGISLFVVVGPDANSVVAQSAKPELVAAVKSDESDGAAALSPDGKTLVRLTGSPQGVGTIGADGKLKTSPASRPEGLLLWDVATRKVSGPFETPSFLASRAAFSPNGKVLAIYDYVGVALFDVETKKSRVFYRIEDGDDMVGSLAFSPDSRFLATGHNSGKVMLWDVATHKLQSTMTGVGWIQDLAFLPDGKTIVGAAGARQIAGNGIWLWDVEGKRKPRFWKGNKYPVQRVAVSQDGRTVAAADWTSEVVLWDVGKEHVRQHLKSGFKLVHAIAFSHDGRALIGGGGNGNLPGLKLNPGVVTIWAATTGKEITTFRALHATVGEVSLSKDGKLMAVSSSEGHEAAANIWDISRVQPSPNQPAK